jgi:hypothetical protein
MDWRRFWEWILFGVMVGAFPVLARFLVHLPEHPSWDVFLAAGDLFLISAVVCGAGVGRLIMSSQSSWVAKGPMGAICLLLFGLTTWQYVSYCTLGSQPASPVEWVAMSELVFFGASAIVTGFVMGMP